MEYHCLDWMIHAFSCFLPIWNWLICMQIMKLMFRDDMNSNACKHDACTKPVSDVLLDWRMFDQCHDMGVWSCCLLSTGTIKYYVLCKCSSKTASSKRAKQGGWSTKPSYHIGRQVIRLGQATPYGLLSWHWKDVLQFLSFGYRPVSTEYWLGKPWQRLLFFTWKVNVLCSILLQKSVKRRASAGHLPPTIL